ncbi:MAG: putative glycosyltransferase EpsH [candidate division BRC1 bacterium ADurb.BinA364]|nr:MAG: putative glycosyltransferase EpsH [candidate division BRC1 bacterium ADurb.BinA364]
MTCPAISYAIVTMNRREELAGCLDSLRAQSFASAEIVVADNGSADGSPEMVRARFPEARLFELGANLGVSMARNFCAEKAEGAILIYLDDDARLAEPGAAARALGYFERDERLGLLAFRILNAFSGEEERKSIPRADKRRIVEDYPCANFCGAGFAVRREAFLETGMFWPPFTYGSFEMDFSYRLLDRGWTMLRASSIDALHRETPRARPKGQWVYFNARDRLWAAARNLPWPQTVSMALGWWGYAGAMALRRGWIGPYLRGVRDGLAGLPAAIRSRQPIRKEALRKTRELSGRYWL